MDFKIEIENLREEFAVHRQHNDRVMTIIDELYREVMATRSLLNMKIRDIDDEQ